MLNWTTKYFSTNQNKTTHTISDHNNQRNQTVDAVNDQNLEVTTLPRLPTQNPRLHLSSVPDLTSQSNSHTQETLLPFAPGQPTAVHNSLQSSNPPNVVCAPETAAATTTLDRHTPMTPACCVLPEQNDGDPDDDEEEEGVIDELAIEKEIRQNMRTNNHAQRLVHHHRKGWSHRTRGAIRSKVDG
jgi:hypothetical protein